MSACTLRDWEDGSHKSKCQRANESWMCFKGDRQASEHRPKSFLPVKLLICRLLSSEDRDSSVRSTVRNVFSRWVGLAFPTMFERLSACITRLNRALERSPQKSTEIVNIFRTLLDLCDSEPWQHRAGGFASYWSAILESNAVLYICKTLPRVIEHDTKTASVFLCL